VKRGELLAPEIHVLHHVEVVGEREILVDDLDAERGRVLRPVDGDRVALEEDLALVDRVDAGDALDQRRLAGAVVADERHHLAGGDVEVDLVERLDGAEALRDPPELQDRAVAHGAISLLLAGHPRGATRPGGSSRFRS
jgi:hypothetical protein